MKTFKEIQKALILGSGALGLRIGLQCAIKGIHTTIYDIDEEAFERAKKVHDKLLGAMIRRNKLTTEVAEEAKARLHWTTNLEEALDGADFVSESVTEDLELKKKVWGEVGALCSDDVILTTNTSSLLPSQFANETDHSQNFCAFHFHDVFYSNVVDIMLHPTTDPSIVPVLKDLAVKLDQVPVVLEKESSGYAFNAMLGSILDVACKLVADGVASIEDVDRAWLGNMKTSAGPFGLMDMMGLDTIWHVSSAKNRHESQQVAEFIKPYVDQGKLGVKTGEGFYKYPNPAYRNKDFLIV